ncbi:MAG: hypothetical protein OEU26_21085 [Candidatus Tectomicrobia bacterium]|nr:hypothetical protein [Candidatus Tectomicrobia bacterium]
MIQAQTDLSPTHATMTLDLVCINFQQWRIHRVKRGKIPAELMEQAYSLVGHYPVTKITKGLGLCCSRFRAQCIERGLIQHPSRKTASKKPKAVKRPRSQVTFVEVNTASKPSALPLSDGPIRMALRRTDGTSLEIALSQTGAAAELMAQFIRE